MSSPDGNRPNRRHTLAKQMKAKASAENQNSQMLANEFRRRKILETLERSHDEARGSRSTATQSPRRQQHAQQRQSNTVPVKLDDFKTVKILGNGGFGQVKLVVKKNTNRLYAIKILEKAEMAKKGQVVHVQAERDFMVETNNRWLTKLIYSFQDKNHLYLTMEYMPGGDLRGLLRNEVILSERKTQFYVAEIALAIDTMHRLGFIHRDIKPANVLLDARGHVKLGDFGLCARYYKADQTFASLFNMRTALLTDRYPNSKVGTLGYIAPEIFRNKEYGRSVDWWSLGITMFELIIGQLPFGASFCLPIMFPRKYYLSDEAKFLILRFCSKASSRIGSRNGVEDMKSMAFFAGVDWLNIRDKPAIPLKDHSNSISFLSIANDIPEIQAAPAPRGQPLNIKDLPKFDYTAMEDYPRPSTWKSL